MNELKELFKQVKPKMIVSGATAYPRIIDFKQFHEIAEDMDAISMADISHIAGLVAAGLHQPPFLYADVVTTTTHKILRGPRGAVIFVKKELAEKSQSNLSKNIELRQLMSRNAKPHQTKAPDRKNEKATAPESNGPNWRSAEIQMRLGLFQGLENEKQSYKK